MLYLMQILTNQTVALGLSTFSRKSFLQVPYEIKMHSPPLCQGLEIYFKCATS